MNKVITWILYICGGLFILFFLIGFISGYVKQSIKNDTVTAVTPSVLYVQPTPIIWDTPVPTADPREANAEQIFTSGCNKSGQYGAYCGCVWQDLRSEYSIDQIVQMGNEYNQTEQLPQEMDQSINACAYLINP